MKALCAALLLLGAGSLRAADLPGVPGGLPAPAVKGWLTVGGGLALPFGGHWGDASSGFKPSGTVFAAVSRKIDDTYSWGVDGSYAFAHRYRRDDARRLSLGSLTPFYKASFPYGAWRYYGLAGAGLYFWRSAAPLGADSGPGTAAGVNLGFGFSRPLAAGLDGGFELRWHHLFSMNGPGLDLESADNLCLLFTLAVPAAGKR